MTAALMFVALACSGGMESTSKELKQQDEENTIAIPDRAYQLFHGGKVGQEAFNMLQPLPLSRQREAFAALKREPEWFTRTVMTRHDLMPPSPLPPAGVTGELPQLTPFIRHKGVAIVTKVHGHSGVLTALIQSLCLLTAAYNLRRQYDVVVFSTLPLQEQYVNTLRAVTRPARLTVASDTMGESLLSKVQAMGVAQKADLFFRCNVTRPEELDWFTSCCVDPKDCARLNYGWQAEFRASHLWSHPALVGYKYMLWLDADAFCTEVWKQDPIDIMVRNDLVLLFANLRGHTPRDHDLVRFTKHAFSRTTCYVKFPGGNLTASGSCSDDKRTHISLVHGFFHITNLDFFRSPTVSAWSKILTEANKFSRKWDDQLAVTLPPAILAPNRSWHMGSHGIRLNVFHNQKLNGREQPVPAGFKAWFKKHGHNFPEGRARCKINARG